MREVVESAAAPAPVGPYSQALAAGDLLVLSGQIGIDPATGLLADGGVENEARRALENLGAVLRAAGLDLSAVIKTTIYLTDIDDYPVVNAAYAGFFRPPYPARSTVGVAKLPRAARIEIDALAMHPRR